MADRSNHRPEHQVERRKNPRAESNMRYKRLRQEAEPPQTIAAASEGLFTWIKRAGDRVTAAVANLFGVPKEAIRRRRQN